MKISNFRDELTDISAKKTSTGSAGPEYSKANELTISFHPEIVCIRPCIAAVDLTVLISNLPPKKSLVIHIVVKLFR